MPLREEFSDAIRRAEERRSKGHDLRNIFLHQVIAGPGRSGKTYLARQYINALVAQGLVEDKIVDVRFPGNYINEMLGRAKAAKGGVLLVDDIYGTALDGMQKSARNDIFHAMIANECTVVLLGSEEMMREFTQDEAISRRMNKPVILTQEADSALQHPITIKKNPFALRKPGRKAETS